MKDNVSITKNDAENTLKDIHGWIKSSDTKFSILLGVVAVLFSLTTEIFKILPYAAENTFSVKVFFAVLFWVVYVLSSLSTLIICLSGLFSRMKTPKTNSMLYFGSIANQELNEYKFNVLATTEEEKLDDLLNQIHINSRIAEKKMKLFNCAIVSAVILITSTILSLIFLFGIL